MDERDQMPDPTPPLADDAEVRRLLEAAGPRPPVPEEDLAAIAAGARWAWEAQVRRQAKRRRWPARAVVAWAALAAMLVLSLGLGWWLASRQEAAPAMVAQVEALTGPVRLELEGKPARRLAVGESIPHGAVLRTGSGGGEPASRASLRLAGGATLRVDVATRLRFAAADLVDLRAGAVYADTGPNGEAGAALAVRTALGTARDVGTQFAVRLEAAAPAAMRVRVRDGAVVVERAGRSYRTATGQELVLQEDGAVRRLAVPAYGPGWEWVMAAGTGFEIEGRSLRELLDWVARETGWQVRFADPGLAAAAERILLHGDPGPLRPDEAPFLVLPGAGLEGELQNGELTVRRAGA